MKYSRNYLLPFLFIVGSAQASKSQYIQLASVKFETPNFDRVEILKESSPGPGDFHKVNIFNHDKLVFSFDEVLDSASHSSKELKNLSKSDLFILVKLDEDYIFMFFGYPFASDPGKMVLIRAAKQGLTKFFDDEFEVSDISRLNDRTLIINGQPKISQGLTTIESIQADIFTYAPITPISSRKD
jgi:hypothetical protein